MYVNENEQREIKRLKHERRRTVLLTLLITVLTILVGGVVARAQAAQNYDRAYHNLQSAVKSSADMASLSADDVVAGEKLIVSSDSVATTKHHQKSGARVTDTALNLLKSIRTDAEAELKESDSTVSQWSVRSILTGWLDAQALQNKAAQFNARSRQLAVYTDAVSDSHQRKLLSDARSALNSTILSVETLAQNTTLSSDTRSKLAQEALVARRVSSSSSVSTVEAARKELDDLVNSVNDEISRNNQDILDIEAAVRTVKTTADSSGSYVNSAVKIIHAGGLSEVWGLSAMRGACAITAEQQRSWMAAYCESTPTQVYINSTLGAETTKDSYFADAMRHEVAHHLIHRRCGTTEPASIGDSANAESVASSYAVLYLGANAATLNRATDSRYYMNQASDDAAARIHAGQCS